MADNKFILLIVEGDLDFQFYGELLTAFANDYNINIKVTDGDILSKVGYKNPQKIIEQIFINELEKSKLEIQDFIQIIQICDLDGSYFPSDIFITDPRRSYFDNKSYEYSPYNSKVYVKDEEKKEKLLKTWSSKRENQKNLFTTTHVLNIPYQIFYTSLFLEHILKGDVLIPSEEKRDCIDNYLDYNSLEDFMELLESKKTSDNYIESWEELDFRENYYSACSNLNILFSAMKAVEFI